MLVLSVALVGPYFVDWTSYRDDFEREAGRILGREVTVGGTATAKLLPFPSVTFTDVVVAGVTPGEPAMTVERFSMDAELAPFMRGDVHIFDMRLVRPSVVVDVAQDGALDWTVRPSVPIDAHHISLERLTVTEGKITVRHAASGRTHTLTEINADASARSLAGPWRMEGSLRLDGMRTAITLSTGAADAGGGMRVKLRAAPERFPFVLEADGNARIEDGRARYAGSFRLNDVVAAREEGGRAPPPTFRLAGAFDFDHTALRVDEFRLETGPLDAPYVAEGSAELLLGPEPGFLIRADGAQIRFDDLAQEAGAGVDLAERLAMFREFLLDLPRPAIPGRIEVALPAIVAGDTTIREVRLSAEPVEGGWSVASLAATLPGRTTLEAEGALTVADELGFEGTLLLAVGQPSGFAAWLAKDVDDAIRLLPAAGFSADVTLGEQRQSFRNLELMLGDARFRGEIESRTPADQRPSMTLRLDGDRLDVEGMTAFASLFVSDSGEARLAGRDLDFEIAAGPVTAAGLTAETLDTALRFRQGALEIDRLAIGGLAGANISATGSLSGIGREPVGTLDATVIAADLAPLAATLAERFPESIFAREAARRAQSYPGLFEDASIQLLVSSAAPGGGPLALDVRAEGEAGGTAFTLTARLADAERGFSRTPLALEFSATNDDAASLYALAGLPALPFGLTGAGGLKLSFDGALAEGGPARLSFTGDDLAFTFDGAAALDAGVLSANGRAALESADIEPWLAAAGVALPGYGLGLPVRLAAELDTDGTLLMLSGLGGEVAGSPLSGDLNAQMRDGLPHLTGALTLRAFDLAAVAEMVFGADAFAPGEGSWPTAPFSPSVSTPATAEIDLAVERLSVGGFAEADDARLSLRLGREGFSVSGLDARLHGGALSGIVDLRNDGGTGLLSAQLQLSGARAQDLLENAGISGTLDIGAALTAAGKSVDGLVATLGGSGTAGIRDVTIEGVNPGALAELLRVAEGYGPQIDAAATLAFAVPLVRDGAFSAEGVDIAFTVANGLARTPPVRLETAGAVLAADLRADLRDGTVGAEAVLTYEAGTEALAGSEPAVRLALSGPPGAALVEVDTAPLAQFLTQRALEAEQQRVEAMQAALLERQRHRREARYYAVLAQQRSEAAEEARREAERLERRLRQMNEEESRRVDEDEARLRAEEEQRRAAEAATEAARQAAAGEEAERQRLADEELLRQEDEALRRKDERLRAEVEALLRARPPEAQQPGAAAAAFPPPVVGVTPTPRPDQPAAPPPPAIDVFSGQSLSGDGFMRMLRGED